MDQAAAVFADPNVAAGVAHLRYVSDEDTAGISRRPHRGGFAYFDPKGARVKQEAVLSRIRALAIPPAWTSVWISPFENAHLVATGRDVKGRKQYRYNPAFVLVRGQAKYEHLLSFAESLPDIRAGIAKHMALHGLPREKVLATVVKLLESTLIRIGNEDYVKENGSFGLTTLRDKHVHIAGSQLRFLFHGKSGKTWHLNLQDRRVAKIVRSCQELPGQHLFQYRDESGAIQKVASGDVNTYLREMAGREITAKDFRTWAGTVEMAVALHDVCRDGKPPLKKHVRAALERAAARLGNTVTICRKCYVHPAIISAYEAGELALKIPQREAPSSGPELSRAERAVLNFLRRRVPPARSRA